MNCLTTLLKIGTHPSTGTLAGGEGWLGTPPNPPVRPVLVVSPTTSDAYPQPDDMNTPTQTEPEQEDPPDGGEWRPGGDQTTEVECPFCGAEMANSRLPQHIGSDACPGGGERV